MKIKKRKILNIVAHSSIFFLVTFSYMMMAMSAWGGSGMLSSSGVTSLRYFTVLSNLLMGVISAIIEFFEILHYEDDEYKRPLWLRVLELVGVTGVTITFLVVIFFLEPQIVFTGGSFIDLYLRSNFFMHFLVPVLAALAYIFLGDKDDFSWKNCFFAIIPLAIYGIFYLINYLVHGAVPKGPEDWYGFGMWGAGPSFFVLLLVLAFGFGVATLLYRLKRLAKKEKKNTPESQG